MVFVLFHLSLKFPTPLLFCIYCSLLNILEYLGICFLFFFSPLRKIFVFQIRDVENKLRPITLASLIGVWRDNCGSENCDESVSGASFISEVSEELSSQLQSGIIKIARRALLDEIISSTISDFLNAKKRDEHLKSVPASSAANVVKCISVIQFVFAHYSHAHLLCTYMQIKNLWGYH